MNKKLFEIFKRYRERRYTRDSEKLKNDFANRGLTFSGMRENEEKWLKEDYEDEVAMKDEETSINETKTIERLRERRNLILTNRILSFVAIVSFLVTSFISWKSLQVAHDANEISAQLRDLNFLVNLQPVLTSAYNSESSTITLTNFGTLPVFIDAVRITRIDQERASFKLDGCDVRGQDRTIAPKQSVSFDFLENTFFIPRLLKKGDFFVPFAYQIFFQVVGNPRIYIGEVIFFFDENNGGSRFNRYLPEVRIASTNYSDFHKLYEESVCPQSQ